MRSSRIYPSVLDRIIDIQRALESSLNFLKMERRRKLSYGEYPAPFFMAEGFI